MKLQHANLTKRKQVILAVGSAATLIGLLVFGLWVSDPNKDQPSVLERQREKAREVTKDFRTKKVVSDKENWMAKSEEKLAEQSHQIREMSSSMRTIEKRLTALGIDVGTRSASASGEPNPRPPAPVADGPSPLDLFTPPAPGTVNPPDSGGTAVARTVPGTTSQPGLTILPARAGRRHPGRGHPTRNRTRREGEAKERHGLPPGGQLCRRPTALRR